MTVTANVVTVLQTYMFMIMSESGSDNIVNGMNALKCAFQSGFVNVWKLWASLWFAARAFEQTDAYQDAINQFYPYLCTCKEDADNFTSVMGSTK